MDKTMLWSAFLIGIVTACSMPLGALTSFVWRPRRRILACLIAFGGGALLAAVVIDLVGNVKEKGHLVELVVGSIVGSLFFIVVNQIVNDSGGFLRKPSTLVAYLTQQESRLLKRRMLRLKHLAFFQDLPEDDLRQLAQSLRTIHSPQGTTLYSQGDSSSSLYVIEQGKIELFDPQSKSVQVTELTENQGFDHWAFFTDSPYQTVATTASEVQLAALSRSDFEALLETSRNLVRTTQQMIQREEVSTYLKTYQGLTSNEVKSWVGWALEVVDYQRKILPAVEQEQNQTEFLKLARHVRRFPVFSYLPQDDLEEIADRLMYRHTESGQLFFQPSEVADRLYFIHQGDVEILYPSHLKQAALVLTAGDAFGELSFVTGARHTVTAIAKTDGAVWILRRQDFEELLQESEPFAESVRGFLQMPEIQTYLHTRQNLEATKTAEWVKQALNSMNVGQLIPGAIPMAEDVRSHHNAPMSIWLGLLMDAIPEALTIGAQLSHHPISLSLVAGLFIANYPEALSSSRGMREQGFPRGKILLMWTSIMLVTGVLAALGSVIFAESPDSVISLLEAMAAGAILTVIAETMLPEAYAKGGSTIGLATLLGFLVIIIITSFE